MAAGGPALVVLEDGSAFPGRSLGADGEWVGEVVFNTSMTGYQEVITDPSYRGQMVVFTCPHIGNVGVNPEDAESRQPHVRAVIAREICDRPSNWRAAQPLPRYLREAGVPALTGIDTRRLTLTLRDRGVMRGALSTVSPDAPRLRAMACSAPDMRVLTPVDEVTVRQAAPWALSVEGAWLRHLPGEASPSLAAPRLAGLLIVIIDCGVKHNILRHLVGQGARATVVPAQASPEEVLALQPDAVLFSNGPGDPEQATQAIATARSLMGRLPIFGICLGHQILGLAAGARIVKLPFGHHGSNHPVLDLATGRVEITAQNHNYAVDAASLAGLPLAVTHLSLFDGTVEGMRHRSLPISSVQFHPEASPGPHDSLHLLAGEIARLSPRSAHAQTG
jgi:carbamoyl-phosphate synthase small subunit